MVPVLIGEPAQKQMLSLIEQDPKMAVWWGTPVEILSAIARQERMGHVTVYKVSAALEALEALSETWQEVLPTTRLRGTAQRLVRVHPLRAADALQLAAAVTALEGQSAFGEFVCLDSRLADAARREGLRVLP